MRWVCEFFKGSEKRGDGGLSRMSGDFFEQNVMPFGG